MDLFEVETVAHTEAPSRQEELRQIIEALFISTGDPLPLDKLKEIISISYPIKTKELREIIAQLQTEYKREKRGFQIDEIAGGFMLRTPPEARPFVEHLHRNRRGEKLTKAALEVLAIVAYKQPITRPQIEVIRGVDSSGTLSSLLERGLVEIVGRLESPGRPSLYGVTRRFLKHFGLKDLQDLSRL